MGYDNGIYYGMIIPNMGKLKKVWPPVSHGSFQTLVPGERCSLLHGPCYAEAWLSSSQLSLDPTPNESSGLVALLKHLPQLNNSTLHISLPISQIPFKKLYKFFAGYIVDIPIN